MEFCDICDNMLYCKHVIQDDSESDDNNGVEYFCKFCGNTRPFAQNEPKLISSLSFERKNGIEDIIGDNIVHDRSLPHVSSVNCVNENCNRGDSDNDVILLRYDKNNSKFLYYCTHCKTRW